MKREMKLYRYVRTFCWVIAILLLCSGVLAAQQESDLEQEDSAEAPQQSQRSMQARRAQQAQGADAAMPEMGSEEAPPAAPSLSADRLIELLQDHPDMLETIRTVAVKRLQDQGHFVTEDDITDEVLFARIREDQSLRVALTAELKNRGYLTEEDLASLTVQSQGEDMFPRLKQRPNPLRTDRDRDAQDARDRRDLKEGPQGLDQKRAEAKKREIPYKNMPALQDLYRQVPGDDAKLKRFGSDIFRNAESAKGDPTQMDLPAGPDYVLGPGDGLDISIWGSTSMHMNKTVDREGRIALPDAGLAVLAGHTLDDARQIIQKMMSTQYRDVRTDVSLTRLRTVRVYVVGDVEKPGAYDISSLSTALNALFAAGGPTPRGSLRAIRHLRGDQVVDDVDLYQLLLKGIRGGAKRFEPGDTLLVPPVGPQVTVTGMVRRPAIYELKSENELEDVLDLAGGVLVSATLRHINVERIEAHERHIMLSANMPQSDDKAVLKKALGDFHVQDGDRIAISPILPYSDKTVYLEGHVFRPGKYPYHDGIEVNELLRSYQDVLPEPADRAEIVRLEPPDYRPTTIEFKLSDILTGDDPIVLKPFDTVRVYGRYENDAPKVSIYGEVLKPGKYPLAQGMTAGDLVKMAGGFKRSAYQTRADITSYVVHDGERVRTEHQTIEIGKALAGDPKMDVSLKAGDVVTIHQISGWKDIGASVTLRGEVMYPGTYGIEEGETLSSILKRAGGFRREAYPEGSVLERLQVRQMAEKNRQELIQRIQSGSSVKLPGAASLAGDPQAVQAAMAQRRNILTTLKSQPASGRLVIKIGSDIRRWQGTSQDIEVRAGDVLTIPKSPNFVLISGQVYNPTAITYSPGKNTAWYLRQAGGPTQLANKKGIYIIRANGSVVGESGAGSGWWSGSVMSTALRPGDAIIVPEKILAPSGFWRNALTAAQLMSSMAITAGVVATF
jgi:protein involved in polysaccharide export with SLBB domain